MKVIQPITITDSQLISTNVPIANSVWVAGTSYAKDVQVEYGHRTYMSLIASNIGNDPTAATSVNKWIDVGPSNAWGMFDTQVSTASVAASSMKVVIKPGMYINSLCLINMQAITAKVTITDGVGGPVVYTYTAPDATQITDWYMYYFEPYAHITELILTDIPPYINGVVTIELTGDGVAVGYFSVGTFYDIGDANFGASVSIEDYSKVVTDEYGNTTLTRRNSAKKTSQQIMIPRGAQRSVFKIIDGLRAIPCVWIPSDTDDDAVLTAFGIYSNFSLTVSYPSHAVYNLEIKGMT